MKMVAITVNQLLGLGRNKVAVYNIHAIIDHNYTIKRLGRPTKVFGWAMKHGKDGFVPLTQSALFSATI